MIASADYYGNRDDFCIAIDFPLLVFDFYLVSGGDERNRDL